MLSVVDNWFRCYTLVCFLTFFVCEAVVGLALLVGAARNIGFYSSSRFCSLKF